MVAKVYPPRKMSGRGWPNKSQVQDGIAPTEDTSTASTGSLVEGQRNPRLRSLNPAVLCKKQLHDPDIGPVLECIESGQSPFGPKVCASSPATRHYWNCLT